MATAAVYRVTSIGGNAQRVVQCQRCARERKLRRLLRSESCDCDGGSVTLPAVAWLDAGMGARIRCVVGEDVRLDEQLIGVAEAAGVNVVLVGS